MGGQERGGGRRKLQWSISHEWRLWIAGITVLCLALTTICVMMMLGMMIASSLLIDTFCFKLGLSVELIIPKTWVLHWRCRCNCVDERSDLIWWLWLWLLHLFLIFTFCLPIIWPLRSLRCWNKSSPWSPSLCACLLPDCFSPNGAPTYIPFYCGITIWLPVLYSLELIVAQCSVFLLFCVFLVLSIVVCVFQRGPYCVVC